MGLLQCLDTIFSPRQLRRNSNLSLVFLLSGYIIVSTLTRFIILERNRQPKETDDLRAITLKPGLLEAINATEPCSPSTLNAVYTLQNKRLCSSRESVKLVVMVYTATENFDRRNLMRQTWLNETLLASFESVRVVFLLGKPNTTKLQNEIENEFKQHGDILQADFLDTYANLTLKGVMGLKWLSENCQNAELLMKVDDDIVINTYRFFKEIVPELLLREKQVFCYRSPRSIIFRGVKHKSYLPKNYFYGQHSYPLYCKGPFVFMTFDLVSLIVKSVSMTPFLWLEDVYLYGLAMQNIFGIKFTQFRKGVDFDLEIDNVIKCFNDSFATCEIFVAAVTATDEMMSVWTAMLKQNQQKLLSA